METSQGVFTEKLCALEREHERLQRLISVCQGQDRSEIFLEMQKIKDESIERELLLEKVISESQSPGVSELADAQLSYRRKVEQGLYRVTTDCHSLEERAEDMSLYAGYSIDLAIQAMSYAAMSVLMSIDLQLSLDEQHKESPNDISTQERDRHE